MADDTNTYADEDSVSILLESYGETVTCSMKDDACKKADSLVEMMLKDSDIPSTPPKSIKDAATFFAASIILTNLYDASEGESRAAKNYERWAREIIEGYLEDHQELRTRKKHTRNVTPPSNLLRTSKKYGYTDSDLW